MSRAERILGGIGTEPEIAVLPEQREPSSDPSAPPGERSGASINPSRPQPVVSAPYVNSTERVIDSLSEAAQRIAEEEHVESILHKRPRASRLAPLRDISADIRRESTPSVGTGELGLVHLHASPIPSSNPPIGAQFIAPLDLVPAPEDRIIDEHTPVSGQFPSIVDTPEISVGPSAERSGVGFNLSPPPPIDRPAFAPEPSQDLSKHIPDLWPWLMEPDPEDSETDTWANRTDPLTLRHFPSSSEAARIEEEDIRRAMAEGAITVPVPPARRRTRSWRRRLLKDGVQRGYASTAKQSASYRERLRIIFLLLAVLAMVALIVDGVLLSAALLRSHRATSDSNGPATLTLSTHTARINDTVTARVSHFAPSTSILLTHDIEEPVQTAVGSSMIKLDAQGNASVSLRIDTSWGPGFHTLSAEDITTRYTASTQLQIIDAGQTPPSHLLIDPMPALLKSGTLLNMGADYQGTSTITLLTLRNSGDGTPISWTASSNRPWLMIAPTSGIFSASQTISIAVDRANLKAGTYHDGLITLSSNVGAPPPIAVEMSVKPLPTNPGPVLAVIPAVLSFTATDGGPSPTAQSLTITNPGTQPLHWSLTGNNPLTPPNSNALFHALGVQAHWLTTTVTAGTVLPNASESIRVNVNSRSLLPGTYTDTLVFSPNGKAYDNAQTVNVSLTVQPQCGLATSAGNLSFTAVAGQSNPTNQTLSLTATPSCATSISWTAMSSASWLSVTPDKGSLNGTSSTIPSIAVNASGLAPGTYTSMIAFITKQSTQTVAVQLTVQPKPSAAAPIIALSGLTLNFSSTQGQSTSTSQVVTITNNGGSTLYWSTSATQYVTKWLGDFPSEGVIPQGKTGQLSVNVNTAGLTPGTYVGQIRLVGRDANYNPASGSPQTITVNLLVLPPCLLAPPSASSLVFNATQGGANPAPQAVQITASGNCNWPLDVHASVSSGASWLNITESTTSISVSGQSITLNVAPHIDNLSAAAAPYTAQVTITATDSAGIGAQGSPQTFSVSLSVAQPVQPGQLNLSTTTLAFTAPNAAPQSVTLSEQGSCAFPISWTATTDSASSSWLTPSSPSGSDSGTTSTLTVSVNSANLAPNTYAGQITISASNAGGTALQGSPQTITVTLTVPGFTISGIVLACSDPTCSTPAPLAGATLTVLNGSNQTATATADTSGNYTLPALAPGIYTINVSGNDSNGTHYSGTTTLTVTADQTNVTIDALVV